VEPGGGCCGGTGGLGLLRAHEVKLCAHVPIFSRPHMIASSVVSSATKSVRCSAGTG
jgi:hypothetical protein